MLVKMNVENFSFPWKGTLCCEDCSTRLSVFRKKKTCCFCKNSFCQVCVVRQENKTFCCRKCQILTARPLDRNKLLNLRSRDLINYLTSRSIPTNGCVEKEDLVNVLIQAVNNSCFHSSSACVESSSSAKSYPNSPRNHSDASVQLSQSAETLQDDGIRITGHNSTDSDTFSDHGGLPEETHSSPCEGEQHSGSSIRIHVIDESHNRQGLDEETRSSSCEGEQHSGFSIRIHVIDESHNRPNNTGLNVDGQSCEASPLKKQILLSDIKSSSDLDALSVKQLKELLLRNRIDFKGCIERGELIQKAKGLWSDYTISRKDLENLSLDDLCKICMDAPIECVLLECGHMATCTSCGKQLSECPICRQHVVRCVRTFKA